MTTWRSRNPQILTRKAAAIFQAHRKIAKLKSQGKMISAHFEEWTLRSLLDMMDAVEGDQLSDPRFQILIGVPDYTLIFSEGDTINGCARADYIPTDNPYITLTFDFDYGLYNKSA